MNNHVMLAFAVAAIVGMAYRWENPGKPKIDTIKHITLEYRP